MFDNQRRPAKLDPRRIGDIFVIELFTLKTHNENDNSDNIHVFLHDNRAPVYDFRNIKPVYYPGNSSKIAVTYTLYKTIKPSTVVNPCIDYSTGQSFKSRDHCIKQCEIMKSRKECLKNPTDEAFSAFANPEDKNLTHCSYPYINMLHVFYNESDFNPEMYPGIQDCNQCPHDCITFMYQIAEPEIIEAGGYPDEPHDLWILFKDINPVILILFSVKLSLSEYIIYVAGCISLWFGCSIFHTTIDLVKSLAISFQSKKQKRKNRMKKIICNNFIQNQSQNKVQIQNRINIPDSRRVEIRSRYPEGRKFG